MRAERPGESRESDCDEDVTVLKGEAEVGVDGEVTKPERFDLGTGSAVSVLP
ncbi:hypothetical protein [Streptomyces sp. AC555_RSS877]|uniref:hypothetical protein n=1 Tax=Streptomyces sp. AC555_RSS877 TaxID=2823688 RepID=UPI001C25AD4D|nr:hypothetical protein [Streptomyces sp. AC555_RSS877]